MFSLYNKPNTLVQISTKSSYKNIPNIHQIINTCQNKNLYCLPRKIFYIFKIWDRPHVSNWWPATSFYVAREANLKPQLVYLVFLEH